MSIRKHIPNSVKKALRPAYERLTSLNRFYRKITQPPKERTELHRYWEKPWDESNQPQDYLKGREKSQFLFQTIRKRTGPTPSVLEIGCNVGRNLDFLYQNGITKLAGIEISPQAVQMLRKHFPEMASHARIYNNPVEEVIRKFKDDEFDVVFTMAVLEHIHKDSEWLFPEMARVSRQYLITIEDEMEVSWRHFPRNYKKIFESLGLEQVEEMDCSTVPGLGAGFIARVFKKG